MKNLSSFKCNAVAIVLNSDQLKKIKGGSDDSTNDDTKIIDTDIGTL